MKSKSQSKRAGFFARRTTASKKTTRIEFSRNGKRWLQTRGLLWHVETEADASRMIKLVKLFPAKGWEQTKFRIARDCAKENVR